MYLPQRKILGVFLFRPELSRVADASTLARSVLTKFTAAPAPAVKDFIVSCRVLLLYYCFHRILVALLLIFCSPGG